MRNWDWEIGSRMPTSYIQIDFVSITSTSLNLKSLVQAVTLNGFVLAAPEAVASLSINREGADFYVDAGSYCRLPYFRERGYYGPYYHIVVTDTALLCEAYADASKIPLEMVTRLIASLLSNSALLVEHWKVWGQSDDSVLDIAEGDHQALIEYLGLKG